MNRLIAARSQRGSVPVLAVTVLFLALFILHLLVTGRSDLPILFGDKTEAIFDLWSIQHFCSGALIGALLIRVSRDAKADRRTFVLFMLAIAIGWETTELAMESGVFGHAVSQWKHGHEHWANRFVGDPAMVALGGLTARRYAWAWKAALLPCAIWLIVNIAAHDSMSINRLVFGP